jgi:hypothetical protein
MNIKFDDADQTYNWLLCDCPCCGHDKPELKKFAPIGSHHIYFAICSVCKNSTEDCKTVHEAIKKWDEKFECT